MSIPVGISDNEKEETGERRYPINNEKEGATVG